MRSNSPAPASAAISFRTARYDRGYLPTGIYADGEPDYGDTFWRQQGIGVVRLARALFGRAPAAPVEPPRVIGHETR
jgi:hypothetical protein